MAISTIVAINGSLQAAKRIAQRARRNGGSKFDLMPYKCAMQEESESALNRRSILKSLTAQPHRGRHCDTLRAVYFCQSTVYSRL